LGAETKGSIPGRGNGALLTSKKLQEDRLGKGTPAASKKNARLVRGHDRTVGPRHGERGNPSSNRKTKAQSSFKKGSETSLLHLKTCRS